MKAVLVCLLLLIPTVANAQPFGVVMGQKADELQARKTARDFLYHITPSKTHPEMESYVVTATPKQGVCMVRGVGIDHDGDAYGDVIKRIAGELRTQIEATYGPAKLFDHLKYGSIWHEQNDWAMGILKGERSY